MSTLNGKIALITGASRGIGRGVALELAKKGAFVIGTATSLAGASLIDNYLADNGLQGMGRVLDVTDQASVHAFFEALESSEQMPNILVNNAGITADNLLLRMDEDEWSKVIETNLTSVYRITKQCLKSMFRSRYGRIIMIGSVVGSSGNSGQVNYTAAKAGLIGFSKSLAQEMASRGITVNLVAPGFIETDMTDALPELMKTELLKRIPMKRLGKVQDIADAVSFLASDASSYITGVTLHVNGGMYMD